MKEPYQKLHCGGMNGSFYDRKVIFLQLDIHSHKVEFISAFYMRTVNLYSSFITQRGSCGMMIRGL